MRQVIFISMTLLLILVLTGASHAKGRLSSFNAGMTYTEATKFNDDSVSHAENYGYSMGIKFKAHRFVKIGVNLNYTPLRVTEYNPTVAMSRTGWEAARWQSQVISKFNSYNNFRDKNGNPYFNVTWGYVTYFYNYELMLNFEFAPMPEGSRFQPFVTAGGGPVFYYSTGHVYSNWVLNITPGFLTAYPNYSGRYQYDARWFNHKKHRGFYWPVFGGGGLDIMLLQHLSFRASADFYIIAKNHLRNKTDAYYRVHSGFMLTF